MRLQLTTAVATLAWACIVAPAGADNRVGSWLAVYADDDNLTVISPQISGRADLREDVELDIGYDIDVISAASVDVVTGGSPRGYHEERHGGQLGARWTPNPKTSAGITYLLSWERDYQSHGVAVSGSREWIDRRLTTRVDARLLLDRLGRAGDSAELWHRLTTTAGAGTLSWIFDRNTIGDVAYELQHADGFQSSPYRYVSIDWTGTMGPGVSVPEATPSSRTRHAIATRVRRALRERWFGSLQYRLYLDDWGIVSHTGEAEAQRAFGWDHVIIGVNARAYHQSAADFHQRSYTQAPGTIPTYRSADKMLARSWSVLGGLRGELRHEPSAVFDAVRVVAKVELYQQRFSGFAPLRTRRALTTSLGAILEF